MKILQIKQTPMKPPLKSEPPITDWVDIKNPKCESNTPMKPPIEYCPECHSLKRKPNKDCKNHKYYWTDQNGELKTGGEVKLAVSE
jgi:hypothetical protein